MLIIAAAICEPGSHTSKSDPLLPSLAITFGFVWAIPASTNFTAWLRVWLSCLFLLEPTLSVSSWKIQTKIPYTQMLRFAKQNLTNKNCKPTVRITGKLSGKLQHKRKRKQPSGNLPQQYKGNLHAKLITLFTEISRNCFNLFLYFLETSFKLLSLSC